MQLIQENDNDKITAFDTLFTTDHLRQCKILIPHLDHKMQQVLALYIKLSELSYTMSFFDKNPDTDFGIKAAVQADNSQNIPDICNELMQYSTEPEKKKLSQLIHMFSQLKNMQDMMEMLQMVKELFPEGGSDMSDLLSGINMSNSEGGSPDIASLMQIMQMLNGGEQNK